jgi:hypothetical protein
VGGTSRRMPRLETRDRCRPFARSRVRR